MAFYLLLTTWILHSNFWSFLPVFVPAGFQSAAGNLRCRQSMVFRIWMEWRLTRLNASFSPISKCYYTWTATHSFDSEYPHQTSSWHIITNGGVGLYKSTSYGMRFIWDSFQVFYTYSYVWRRWSFCGVLWRSMTPQSDCHGGASTAVNGWQNHWRNVSPDANLTSTMHQ